LAIIGRSAPRTRTLWAICITPQVPVLRTYAAGPSASEWLVLRRGPPSFSVNEGVPPVTSTAWSKAKMKVSVEPAYAVVAQARRWSGNAVAFQIIAVRAETDRGLADAARQQRLLPRPNHADRNVRIPRQQVFGLLSASSRTVLGNSR
jgi:hypothetical protein